MTRFFHVLSFITLPAFLVLASTQTANASEKLQRLDPHGKPDADLPSISIEKQTECKVCHFVKAGKFQTKSDPDQFCASCHGPLPHSGVAEHKENEIGCLSCHDPHRATLDGSPRTLLKPSFLKLQRDSKATLPSGLRDHSNPNPMLGHSCTECHDWN